MKIYKTYTTLRKIIRISANTITENKDKTDNIKNKIQNIKTTLTQKRNVVQGRF